MPYQSSTSLPGEHASRLGHLQVLNSPLVQRICESFRSSAPVVVPSSAMWQPLPTDGQPLPIVFAVDGSLQPVVDERPPHKTIMFIKTALLRLDRVALAKIDPDEPHPFALRDLLADAALYHATVLPLRHVNVAGYTTYNLVRETIFQSLKDDTLECETMQTFKWLAYEKWDGARKSLPSFECPHCGRNTATLPYDAEDGPCPSCGEKVLLSDMLGFHQDMAPDAAPDGVASMYMLLHETLLLFTAIRLFWESNRAVLKRALFLKDGPLSIRAQYSKLVNPIRRFLSHASREGYTIALVGQEKSGAFWDHLQVIGPSAPENSLFVPDDAYMKSEVQHRPLTGDSYGQYTNYGAKVFARFRRNDLLVLNIVTGAFNANPTLADLYAASDIFATLPTLISARYSGALMPIALANDVASLSTYPSARILKIFAETVSQKPLPVA